MGDEMWGLVITGFGEMGLVAMPGEASFVTVAHLNIIRRGNGKPKLGEG